MKTTLVVVFATFIGLTGCASPRNYGSQSPRYESGYSQRRADLPAVGTQYDPYVNVAPRTDGYRYVDRPYRPVRPVRNTGVFGLSGSDTGSIGGGIVGAVIGDALGLRGSAQALSVFFGMIGGNAIGSRRDAEAAEIGYTNCGWDSSGYIDPNGVPHQRAGGYGCSGGNSTYGNRNYPPLAEPQ